MRDVREHMERPELDVDRRFRVWDAMSEMYLDNELTERNIEWIAKVCADSPYTLRELDQIMFCEVWPVLASNLLSYVGEWRGFDAEWLKRTILEKCRTTYLLPWWMNPIKLIFWWKWFAVRARVKSKRSVIQGAL
jgi:hypothetical protein